MFSLGWGEGGVGGEVEVEMNEISFDATNEENGQRVKEKKEQQ